MLPQGTERVAYKMGKIERFEMSHVLFVQTQELAAGRQIVVHDIEHLAIDPLLQSRQCNRLGTVIDVRERYRVCTAQMQKDTKRTNAHPAGDGLLAGAINVSGPDD